MSWGESSSNLRRQRRSAASSIEKLEDRCLLATVDMQIVPLGLDGTPISEVGAGQDFYLQGTVQDIRPNGIRGVFAAYADLEFNAEWVAPVKLPDGPAGHDIQFGIDYQNGTSVAVDPTGMLDEIGAFQSSLQPLGPDARELFRVKFQADAIDLNDDVFRHVSEDSEIVELDVLHNDRAHPQRVTFALNPADVLPAHEVLHFQPTDPVPAEEINFGSATLDIVNDGITIVEVTSPNQGGTVEISADGSHLRYRPAPDFWGQESFVYRVNNGETANVMVLVKPINDAPVAVADLYELEHGQPSEIPAEQGTLANDQDVDRDDLTATLVAGPENGEVTLRSDGSFLYRPTDGFRGVDRFRYTASDGSETSNEAEVVLRVSPPEVQFVLQATDLQGNPLSEVPAGSEFDVHVTVQDIRDSGPRGIYAAYLDLDFDGDFITPVTDDNGQPMIEALGGYTNGLVVESNPGQLAHVGGFQRYNTPQGSDPRSVLKARFQASALKLVDDQFDDLTEDGGVFTLDVLANDRVAKDAMNVSGNPTDISPRFDVLPNLPAEPVPASKQLFDHAEFKIVSPPDMRIENVTQSLRGGTVAISEDGRFVTYEPPLDYHGPDSFGYTTTGGSFAEVEVQVSAVPDPPRPQPDVYYVREMSTLEILAENGVLANDADPEGDPITAELVDNPRFGSITFRPDGSFTYRAQENAEASDRFLYRASDGDQFSEPVEVTILVSPPPVQITLEPKNESGDVIDTITAGDTFWVTSSVADERPDAVIKGIYAAYFDLEYDSTEVQVNDASSDIRFGGAFQAGKSFEVLPGTIDELGAFHAGLDPLGPGQFELASVRFQQTGPRGFDDEFQVSAQSKNRFDLLANERRETWEIEFGGNPSDISPLHDVLPFTPPVPFRDDDIGFVGASVAVRNAASMELISAVSASGAAVTLDPDGQSIMYTPAAGFEGSDRVDYVFRDAAGRESTGQATVHVAESWQNQFNHYDVNSDTVVAPSDAIIVINELNAVGARKLDDPLVEPPFLDVSGDQFVSPVDVLMVINHLNDRANPEAEPLESVEIAGAPVPIAVGTSQPIEADPPDDRDPAIEPTTPSWVTGSPDGQTTETQNRTSWRDGDASRWFDDLAADITDAWSSDD